MNCACSDLCGGRSVMGVPTAISFRHDLAVMQDVVEEAVTQGGVAAVSADRVG